MKHQIIPISNVARLREAGQLLLDRAPNMPGMGLIYGATGLGKSTAATWYMNQCNAVLVRAMANWTPSAMLKAILRELSVDCRETSCSEMTTAIVESLARHNRPLFIDEADFLVKRHRMLETLRDLHDLASVPVVLIGMDGIHNKVAKESPQLAGRLMQWVEFQPATLTDTALLADGLCEVKVFEDLVALLHEKTGGHVRNIIVGLAQIETHARRKGLGIVRARDWPDDKPFFVSAPPSAMAPANRTGRALLAVGARRDG